MSAGLKAFEICLDKRDYKFSPGEILAGRVFVELNRPKTIRCFKIRIKGSAEVRWTEDNNNLLDLEKKTLYKADELYFREDLYALGDPDTESVNIAAGSHVFPFQFMLPINIPSTFKTKHGEVKYTVKAIMERPWKFDHKATKGFDVLTSYILTDAMNLGTMMYHENHKPFAVLKNGGLVEFSVCLQSNGVEIGDKIQATININNTSAADVKRVKLKLEQRITHNATYPRTRAKNIVKTIMESREIRTFSKRDEAVLSVQVPTVPHSLFPWCSLINIQYFAMVMITLSGLNCTVKREYLITIGVKPAAGVEYEGNASTFEAPFLPSDEFTTNAGAIVSPGPSSKVPPSYNEATRVDEKEKL